MQNSNELHGKQIVYGGMDIHKAGKALIMIHGRGGSAQDILTLADYLDVKDFALLAPQATGNTWYPYSFMAPPDQNEPWLTSALNALDGIVRDTMANGIAAENIYFLGFSQGACL